MVGFGWRGREEEGEEELKIRREGGTEGEPNRNFFVRV
jgi:hypothetical protein